MNRSENRKDSCISDWRQVLIIVAAMCGILQFANASPRTTDPPPEGPPPCPKIELGCDSLSEEEGIFVEPLCQCGPGEWMRYSLKSELTPPQPIQNDWAGSENFVGWRISCYRNARDCTASAGVSISGASSFWHAGSKSQAHVASFLGGWRECWRGAFPACPRSVLLVAMGGGGLGIGDSCAARLGCSSSSTATAAGAATSRGKANASLSNLQIQGSVSYNNVTQLSTITGNFGANILFSNPHLNGTVSSNSSWTVSGQGSATGSMTFSVLPDRTYCAFTNLPIIANWTGTVVVTTAVSVDENGTASGSAAGILTLSVN